MKSIRFSITIILFFVFNLAFPCGWDWDTIKMEKQAFPTIHELITGKFIRHSPAFYVWRVENRMELLKQFPDSLSLYDDLGWAYDKLGEHEKAIAIFLRKDALKPNMYETHANLGTAYIHNGNLEEGVKYIKKAIEINPEAHFGREVYQQHLVEYILSESDSLGKFSLPLGTGKQNFYHYLASNQFSKPETKSLSRQNKIAKAIKGVAGMMQFGNYNSPILLEALGDLLSKAKNGQYKGAGHLASRAYMKASLIVKDAEAKKAYRKKASLVQEIQFMEFGRRRHNRDSLRKRPSNLPTGDPLIGVRGIESILKLEIQSANKWYEQLREDELNWIATSSNPDSAFAVKYYETPKQKPVHMYSYKQKEKEIDEAYWLRVQLENPNRLSNIHEGVEIDDSVRNFLNSVYQEELFLFPEEKSKPEKKVVKGELTVFAIPTYLKIGAFIFVIAIVLVIRYKSLPKRK
jgi:tetratricopeptide (TPR) repeat protein